MEKCSTATWERAPNSASVAASTGYGPKAASSTRRRCGELGARGARPSCAHDYHAPELGMRQPASLQWEAPLSLIMGESALADEPGRAIPVSMQMQRVLAPPRVAIYNRPRFRALFYQFALLATLLWLGYEFVLNAKANLDAQNITSGFGFLENAAGFAVNQTLIPYNEIDNYRRLFLVRLLHYLLGAPVPLF